MFFHIPGWELTLFTWINQDWHNPVFDVFMPLVSSSGFLWILTIALAVIGIRKGTVTMTVIIGLGLSIAVSDLTCSAIKESVGRVRPYQSMANTRYLDSGTWAIRPADFEGTKSKGSSFPSAHSANAAAACMVLFAAVRNKSVWIVPILIGYSRIYLGKHFPMDVLAGWATGLAVASILIPVYPAVLNRLRSRWIR